MTYKDAPMPDSSTAKSLALFKVVLGSLERQRLKLCCLPMIEA